MAVKEQTKQNSTEWVTVREFVSDESGFEYPKYEAAVVDDHGQEAVEDELVIIKEVSPRKNHERMYQFPSEALERVADHIAQQDSE